MAGEAVLRFAVALLCLLSLIVVVRDRQRVSQSVGFDGRVVLTQLRYSDTTGLVFLVCTNGVVAMYCAVVAFTSFFKAMGSTKSGAWCVFLLDQVLAYILLSATSAASEIEYLAMKGDIKTAWDRLCTTYHRFCHMLDISVMGSLIAVILLAITCVFSAKQLFQQYSKVTLGVNKKQMLSSSA